MLRAGSNPCIHRASCSRGLLALVAACQTVPPAPAPTPHPRRHRSRSRRPRRARALRARGVDRSAGMERRSGVRRVARVRGRMPRARCAAEVAAGVAGAVRGGRVASTARARLRSARFSWSILAHTAWQADDGSDVGLVTGYYEPLLAGSRTPTARIQRRAVRRARRSSRRRPVEPLSRAQGQARARPRRRAARSCRTGRARSSSATPRRCDGKALAYVADPVEAFFLEIQGSGRIALTDGTVMRLNYADQNGHPYVPSRAC